MAEMQTEFVKRKLVQYIREAGLAAGDRLPPQRELCKTLNVGSATVSTAIRELAREDILKIRDKVGVSVCKPDADGYTGRTIGITPSLVELSQYTCSLLHLLQQKFLRCGMRPEIFYCQDVPSVDGFELVTFPGLTRSISQQRIDALVDMCGLSADVKAFAARYDIPVFQCGGFLPRPELQGIFVDTEQFFREAFNRLNSWNIKRVAVVEPEEFRCQLKAVERENVLFSFSQSAAAVISDLTDSQGHWMADAIIFLDDVLALNVAAQLAKDLQHKHFSPPHLLSIYNLQTGIDFPLAGISRCVIDLNQMADMQVDMVRKKILDNKNFTPLQMVPLNWQ